MGTSEALESVLAAELGIKGKIPDGVLRGGARMPAAELKKVARG